MSDTEDGRDIRAMDEGEDQDLQATPLIDTESDRTKDSEDMDQDDQSSEEDAEFLILNSDSQDNSQDEKESGSGGDNNDGGDDDDVDSEDGDNEFSIVNNNAAINAQTAGDDASVSEEEEEEREFAIISGDGHEVCEDSEDRDSCAAEVPQEVSHCHTSKPEPQRTLDMYVNGRPGRQDTAMFLQKAKQIKRLLRQEPVDVTELKQQAISEGGLLNAELRRKVWPLLLNVNPDSITPKPDAEVLKSHRDYEQVVLDVNRSIKRFPPGMQETHRLSLQDCLVDVIMRVLVRHPELHYYQGYHDICVTFLLVVDEDMAYALMEKLSQSHLRDFMEPTMERTQQLLDYVPPLLQRANPALLQYIEGAELGNVFCISWLLTWFGHVLSDIESILRIFDFFIACHPLMPVYVMAAVVLHREEEIFATEQEMPALYQLLNKVPDNLPFESLLTKAGALYIKYPPVELANEAVKRFQRAQEQEAARRAMLVSRQRARQRRASSFLPDGNVTFSKVTFWMMGAVVSMAAYALWHSMEWGDWSYFS